MCQYTKPTRLWDNAALIRAHRDAFDIVAG
jgi:hypothetical protein